MSLLELWSTPRTVNVVFLKIVYITHLIGPHFIWTRCTVSRPSSPWVWPVRTAQCDLPCSDWSYPQRTVLLRGSPSSDEMKSDEIRWWVIWALVTRDGLIGCRSLVFKFGRTEDQWGWRDLRRVLCARLVYSGDDRETVSAALLYSDP